MSQIHRLHRLAMFTMGIVLFGFPMTLLAQRSEIWREKPGTWLLNAGAGTTRYLGDLNERGDVAHLRLGAAVSADVAYRLTNRTTFRAGLQLYYIHGTDRDTRNAHRNLSFHSLNPDVWAGLQVDFWQPRDPNHVIIPYALAGIGLTYITPKAYYKGQTYSLAPRHTEGVTYSRLPVILRYGLGVPVAANERFRLNLEGMYTHVLSDYLDDISTVYADRSKMDAITAGLADRSTEVLEPANSAGAQRGNLIKHDGYFVLTARLIFVIITPQQRNYRRMFGR